MLAGMLYKEAFKHISSTQLLHWMGDLEKLLLFAEDIAVEAALDVERVRVCLPPSGFDDSILLLDSIDQVPPDEIWESLNSFIEQKYTTVHSLANGGCSTESYSSSQQKSDHIDSSEPAPIPSPDVNLPENEIFALEGSPERELEPKVLFSPMIEEMMESEQDTDHKCLDRLSLELDSATEDEKPQLATPERGNMCDSETLCVGHSVLDTAVSSTEVPRTSAALASNTHSMDFQSIITAYRPRIEFFGPPQRVLEDTCYSGDVVYYWVTQTFRVRDNLALAAAMRLSAELCVPLVAIAIVEEEEVVQDVMECIQAMSNRKRSLTEVGGNESVEGGSCYEGNLAALHRKSVIRLSILAHLRDDFRRLNIPLVTVAYNCNSGANSSGGISSAVPHTPATVAYNCNSGANSSGGISSAVPHTPATPAPTSFSTSSSSASTNRHIMVTPLLRKPAAPQHPLLSVLLSMCCGGNRDRLETWTGRLPEFPDHCTATTTTTFPTTSSGFRTPTATGACDGGKMHVVSAGPTDVDFHAGGNNSYSTTAAGQGQSPHKGTTVGASSAIPVLSPAALFTDDCLHPLHYFVCQSLASQVRSLPVVSVDSNSLQMRHKKNEQEDSSAFSPGKPEALLSLNAFQQEHRLDQELSAVGFNCNSSTGNSGIKTQQRQDDPDWWPAADFLKDLLPGWEDAEYCATALEHQLSTAPASMGGIGISVVPADLYQGVRIHPLCAQWSPSNANAAAVANPPGDCDDAGDHVSTAAVAAAVVSAYICAGVLSPQRALQYAHTAAPGSATATELSTSLTSATLCTEYARYRLAQQRNGIEISCRKIIPTGAHTWEVSFLDLLSRTAQQQIQQLDSQLSRKTSRFAPEEARKRLQDLYSSRSECTTLNVIQGHLLKRGVLPLFASLKYWFLYHVQIFGTFASAIKCVYRSIALYSLHDINNNCSAVVALVCAVEEVVKEVLNEADSSSGGAFSDGYAEQVDAVLKSYKADIVLKTANIV